MSPTVKKRDLITLQDYSSQEILHLLALAAKMKGKNGRPSQPLKGKSVGLIFQKPSNRTRVSFEVGIYQLGGNCVYLGPKELDLGKRETTADAARTLSRYLDGIVARTHSHQDILDLSRYASIPIINGLDDLFHPCQALADILSIQETFRNLKGLTLAYVGDGNNVCHSLMVGCSKIGMHMNIATPAGYEPSTEVMKMAKENGAQSGARIMLTQSPREAVKGAKVIYADVWVSMGQEAESADRIKNFEGYQINAELVKSADKDFIFMHCLPAHRSQEVTAEVIDGPHSIIFDQAENRMHAQKAVLTFLIGPPQSSSRKRKSAK